MSLNLRPDIFHHRGYVCSVTDFPTRLEFFNLIIAVTDISSCYANKVSLTQHVFSSCDYDLKHQNRPKQNHDADFFFCGMSEILIGPAVFDLRPQQASLWSRRVDEEKGEAENLYFPGQPDNQPAARISR